MLDPGIYIVATPIGNLADITERAIATLSSVTKIAAEDTRHSKKLLSHYNIGTSLISLHEHNESQKTAQLIEYVKEGNSIAIISDAGTPLISDPGYKLVSLAKEAGINVIPIPGPCALIAALSASGIETDKFMFAGFLPSKKIAKEKFLREVLDQSITTIFYESPHRIITTLEAINYVLGDNIRKVTLAREISKKYETIITSNISSILAKVVQEPSQQKGEMVIIVAGAALDIKAEISKKDRSILDTLISELPARQAVAIGTKLTGIRRNIIYDYVLKSK